jgi:pimeloyl-ACP methyl ester carboxylesterase
MPTTPQPDKEAIMSTAAHQSELSSTQHVSIHTVEVDGLKLFYREAGPADAPVLLLLHGFPTSSLMFRELMRRLSSSYRVIAPDLPGFGFTDVPSERKYSYTFDSLAVTVNAFVEKLGLTRFAIYVFDYGAPVGFRLALAHPERITAIVSQNGNAYKEGLGEEAWNPVQRYWQQPTQENRDALRAFLTLDSIRWQYTHGVPDPARIAPETYTLDAALIARGGNQEIQLDLFADYASNVALYPEFQRYLRQNKPPLLAIWGRNDPFFLPPGAEAFRRDDPNTTVTLLDTGHFALETHVDEIASAIDDFLSRSIG